MRSDDPCSKYFVSQRRASRYICCVSYFIAARRHCGLRIWHTRPSAPSAIHVRPCGRAITLREIDFARCAHTKVWGFGKWVAYPPHVRRASELYVGACLCVFTRYGGLVEKFLEGEESEDGDDDALLVVRARTGEDQGNHFR